MCEGTGALWVKALHLESEGSQFILHQEFGRAL